MTGRTIGFLALRLLSVYLFLQALSWASNLLGYAYVSSPAIGGGPGTSGLLLLSIGPSVLFLLASLFFWFRTEKLVGHFTLRDAAEPDDNRHSRFFELALMVAGTILVAVSIPELFAILHNAALIGIDPVMDNPKVRYEIGFGAAKLVTKLLLGGLLVFRTKAIVARLDKWRERQ